jgi:hypothetical protein
MELNTKIYILIALIVIGEIIFIIIAMNPLEKEEDFIINKTLNKENCILLGCPNSTNLIGNSLTNKFYNCLCDEIKNISREKLTCFDSEANIILTKYTKGKCTIKD